MLSDNKRISTATFPSSWSHIAEVVIILIYAPRALDPTIAIGNILLSCVLGWFIHLIISFYCNYSYPELWHVINTWRWHKEHRFKGTIKCLVTAFGWKYEFFIALRKLAISPESGCKSMLVFEMLISLLWTWTRQVLIVFVINVCAFGYHRMYVLNLNLMLVCNYEFMWYHCDSFTFKCIYTIGKITHTSPCGVDKPSL